MPGCAMGYCRNFSSKTKGQGIVYHTFPRDLKRQKLWVLKCRRKDKINVDTACVCSDHFHPEDYMRDLKAELLGYTPRKVLKPTAVPETKPPPDLTVPLTTNRRPGSKILQRNLRPMKRKAKTGGCNSKDAKSPKSKSHPKENSTLSEMVSSKLVTEPFVIKLNDNQNRKLPLKKMLMSRAEAVFNTNGSDPSCNNSLQNDKPVVGVAPSIEFSLNNACNSEPQSKSDSFTVFSEHALVTTSPSKVGKSEPTRKKISKTGTNRKKIPLPSDVPMTNLDAEMIDSNLHSPACVNSVNGANTPSKEVAKKISSSKCEVFEDRTLEELMNQYTNRRKSKGVQTSPHVFDPSPLLSQLHWLEHRVQTLKTTVANRDSKIRKLHSMVAAVKKDAKNSVKSAVNSQVHQILGKLFTANQINCLIKGKQCGNWSEDTLTKSWALREVSRKAYIHLREKMGYPFPGVSTLKRWLNRKAEESQPAPSVFLDTNSLPANEITITEVTSLPIFFVST